MAALPALSAGVAAADEPRSATEPRVLNEPGEVVNVINAFDEGNPFDINVSLGFGYATKSARIMRETHIAEPGLTTGGYTARRMNVADFSETTTRLIPRVDFGIYKDLALHVRVPIILNNSRRLAGLSGTEGRESVVLAGAPGETLFTLPFDSPDRSGLEYLGVGLDFNIMNQFRDPSVPTWLVGIEGRFALGEPMRACNPNPASGQVPCADPSDVNRSGTSDGAFDGASVGERKPGVTRGTVGLALNTMLSKRMKYIEPYGGFQALFEFPMSNSDYGVSNLEGSLVNHPPIVGGVTMGLMIIPWENREKFSRLTFDLRMMGEYRSEGRDYSEMFDAIGSSAAPSLRNPQWARYQRNPDFNEAGCADLDPATPCFPRSVVDQGSQRAYTTGLTTVQAHGSYRASASVTWQASEIVKFSFGLGYRHDQGHGISHDQPCNPDLKGDLDRSGPCQGGSEAEPRSTGIPNPNYRPTINAVGRRFYVEDSNTFDVFASGVVMF